MPLRIVRGDISEIKADAVINTVSEYPSVGAGTDSGINRKAGAELLAARRSLGRIPTGQAAATPAFGLPARYVFHTAGPIWHGGDNGEEELLRSCYRNCLMLASEKNCSSAAFPLLCAGYNGFPNELALKIAVGELSRFLLTHDMEITLAVFDRRSFVLSEKLTGSVEQYIDEHYVEEKTAEEHGYCTAENAGERPGAGKDRRRRMRTNMPHPAKSAAVSYHQFREDAEKKRESLFHSLRQNEQKHPGNAASVSGASGSALTESAFDGNWLSDSGIDLNEYNDISGMDCAAEETAAHSAPAAAGVSGVPDWDDVLSRTDAGFSETLLRLIDRTGRKDSEIYKRANVDRKLFSKIRTNAEYRPSKSTALAFAIALELDLDETIDLISRAGYTLSHSSKSDIIVEYFIESRNYNVFELNEVLFAYHQPLIGV